MKKINILSILFIFLFSGYAYSQNIEFSKNHFPNDKKGLKEAQNNLKAGDKLYYLGEGRWVDAIEFYILANEFNPNNAVLNYKLGRCYMKTSDKHKAIIFLEKAHQLKPNVEGDVLNFIAQAYHEVHDFDKAIDKYREYKNALTPKSLTEIGKTIDKKIKECENGKTLKAEPVRVFIDNMGAVINTIYPEYSPIINADESMIIFTSRRNTTTGGNRASADEKYYEDMYKGKAV